MKVNQHTSHPSAFISSTFVDLQDERASVAETLKDNGLNVNALDIKPATNNTSKTEILKGIRESDFVILIIGARNEVSEKIRRYVTGIIINEDG